MTCLPISSLSPHCSKRIKSLKAIAPSLLYYMSVVKVQTSMISLLQAKCCTVVSYTKPITYIENNLKEMTCVFLLCAFNALYLSWVCLDGNPSSDQDPPIFIRFVYVVSAKTFTFFFQLQSWLLILLGRGRLHWEF